MARWPALDPMGRVASSGRVDTPLPSVCQEPLNTGFSRVRIPKVGGKLQ